MNQDIWTEIKTRWSRWDWHGAPLFHLRPPPMRPGTVRRIVEEFVLPWGPQARILDVGGSPRGFLSHLDDEHRHLREQTVLVDARGGDTAAFRSLADIPGDTPPFELALMFGVTVALDGPALTDSFRAIHRLLRPGGALVITEPDGSRPPGQPERPARPFRGLPGEPCTEADTIRHLRAARFVNCSRRPDLGSSSRYLTVAAYRSAI